MKTEWIALFKTDFTSKVFLDPLKSEDVLYWIKRFDNGLIHEAKSTGNKYPLRNFEFFDSDLNSCQISREYPNRWSCSEMTETSNDLTGSLCFVIIVDPLGVKKRIRMSGWYPQEGWSPSINENLYFSALVIFLGDLSYFKSWVDLHEKFPDLYIEVVDGIPGRFFKEIDRRFYEARKILTDTILLKRTWHRDQKDVESRGE